MTTDWSNTWAGANGWYDGYDSTNTGSFVDISALSGAERDAAIAAVRENIIGLLEQKGVTRAQILGLGDHAGSDVNQFYQQQMANAASGSDNATRNAFQAAAQHTTSGTDRGNKWGADDDATIGRTYLDSIAAGGTATVMDLYNKGFGRTQANMAADTTGPVYWQNKLDSGEMTIQEIAAFFAQSEEANIRDIYADQYNRDADWDGLKYWEAETEGDDSATLLNAVQYRGANPDWVQNETSIRDAGWEYLGQASNQDQRDTMPTLGDNKLFTAMSNTEVANWMSKISSGEMTLEEVIGGAQIDSDGNVVSGSGGELYNRGDYMDAHNQYDVDDWDEDGANPTGMGRFASLQDVQSAIDAGQTPDDVRAILAQTKWGALTNEKLKQFGDQGTSQDLYNQTSNFTSTYWSPPTDNNPKQGDWTPDVPTKPGIPGDTPVDRREIEYMPNQQADQFSSTPYGAAKQEFDREAGIFRPQVMETPRAQDVGQRFTGTSAKGVRMKRSKASRMGTIRGTKQLGREQQTQSLNI